MSVDFTSPDLAFDFRLPELGVDFLLVEFEVVASVSLSKSI
ncbi:MAG: hypothetical protein QF466_00310 [Desulfobacterales bacterium]|nr:hypothetical protein [Desulfobacterales bacterium]